MYLKILRSFLMILLLGIILSSANAGDNDCKGYSSPSNPFTCGSHGNCVWWASYKRPDLKAYMSRDAKYWASDARGDDFVVGYVPRKYAIVVFDIQPSGHVAHIENVHNDGSFDVTEMDYFGTFGDGMQRATYHPASGGYRRGGGSTVYAVRGFIYPKYCEYLNEEAGVFCWSSSNGNFVEGWDGVKHTLHTKGKSSYILLSGDNADKYLLAITRGDYPNSTSVDLGAFVHNEHVYYAAYGGFSKEAGDSPSTTPIGTDPQPIPGPRVDLRPDFDIKDLDGDELSSNCDNCETTPLRPNQEIKLVLTTQVSNEDAGNFKRDDDSDTIEGPIWYRMGEDDSWHKIASGEYTIGKLDEGDSIQETTRWHVPNVPGGTIHFAACVDGDDEIWEEGETDDDDSISSPNDTKAKTNNCSRIERFEIKERPDLRARITLTPSQEFYDALSGINITVRGYAFRDDADKHERWDVPKVKAPLWYRIPGVDGHENWTFIATPQYTTGKLDEGDSVPDTVSWTIPNFPGKTVELASCIDSEDAIYEFDESATSHPITNPDTGGANCTFTNLKVTDPDPVEHPEIDPNDYEHASPAALWFLLRR